MACIVVAVVRHVTLHVPADNPRMGGESRGYLVCDNCDTWSSRVDAIYAQRAALKRRWALYTALTSESHVYSGSCLTQVADAWAQVVQLRPPR
jgi:hypothetical protein